MTSLEKFNLLERAASGGIGKIWKEPDMADVLRDLERDGGREAFAATLPAENAEKVKELFWRAWHAFRADFHTPVESPTKQSPPLGVAQRGVSGPNMADAPTMPLLFPDGDFITKAQQDGLLPDECKLAWRAMRTF